MPAKHRLKQYSPDTYYHIYNRGVEKNAIFREDQDYGVFLSYLRDYLSPKDIHSLQRIIANPDAAWKEKDHAVKLLRLNNFFDNLGLLSYCLMPNHFHFLVHQADENTIDRFMQSLCTRFSMYMNNKYKRVGPLLQDVYKAVLVENDEQLLYLTRYIHRNPLDAKKLASQGWSLRSWSYSSYHEYLGLRNTKWIKSGDVLNNFSRFGFNSYQSFVEGREHSEFSETMINDKAIDDE